MQIPHLIFSPLSAYLLYINIWVSQQSYIVTRTKVQGKEKKTISEPHCKGRNSLFKPTWEKIPILLLWRSTRRRDFGYVFKKTNVVRLHLPLTSTVWALWLTSLSVSVWAVGKLAARDIGETNAGLKAQICTARAWNVHLKRRALQNHHTHPTFTHPALLTHTHTHFPHLPVVLRLRKEKGRNICSFYPFFRVQKARERN